MILSEINDIVVLSRCRNNDILIKNKIIVYEIIIFIGEIMVIYA